VLDPHSEFDRAFKEKSCLRKPLEGFNMEAKAREILEKLMLGHSEGILNDASRGIIAAPNKEGMGKMEVILRDYLPHQWKRLIVLTRVNLWALYLVVGAA
ncbi:hypothetical protein ACLOJK_029467, partial [Asimina triloba]